MKIAVYPGSFDPFTLGHGEILLRGCELFDKIYVVVTKNSNKKTSMFTVEGKHFIIEKCLREDFNLSKEKVEVVINDGHLTVDFCKTVSAKFILRGIRAVTDYEYENAISQTNRSLSPDIDTVFLFSDAKYSFVSSSMVREVYSHGRDINEWVPKTIAEIYRENL